MMYAWDCVSRQAAIDAMQKLIITDDEEGLMLMEYNQAVTDCIDKVAELLPVNPVESVLDKIRAEIADLDDADYDYEGYYKAVTDAVKIIDKYKASPTGAESEVQDADSD